MNSAFKNWGLHIGRVLISATLFYIIARKVDWAEFSTAIAAANYKWLPVVLIALLADRVLVGLRWWILLRATGTIISLIKLLGITLIAIFWGFFLPSSLSIDILNGYYVYKATSRGSDAISSVMVDRLLGLFTMVSFGLMGLVFFQVTDDSFKVFVFLACFLVLLISAASIAFHPKVSAFIMHWLGKYDNNRLVKLGLSVYASLLKFRSQPGALAAAFLVACTLQIARCVEVFAIAMFLNVDVSLAYIFVVVAVMMIFVMLPISVGGVGVREGTFVTLFTLAGLSATQGFMVSLGVTLMDLLLTLMGGVVFMLYRPQAEKAPTEGKQPVTNASG